MTLARGTRGGGGGASITLNVKESYDLARALVFTPPDADNKGVIWTIDEGAAVVTLDTETGRIAAVGTRAAYEAIPEAQRTRPVTVGVTTLDGNKQAACAVTVVFTPVPVASVAINGGAPSLNLSAGDRAALTAAVSPASANNYTLQWTSDNEAAATVDAEGVLNALNVAENTPATVTVTAVDNDSAENNKSASITVNVAKAVIDRRYDASGTTELTDAFAAIAEDTLDDDKEYTITITDDITLTDVSHLINVDPIADTRFQGKKITITDNNSGKRLILGVNRIGGAVITLGPITGTIDEGNEVTVVLTGSITVVGAGTVDTVNNNPLVRVQKGGIFELDGSAKLTGNVESQAGGVYIEFGGKFFMKGGEISGNTAKGTGPSTRCGGVMVGEGQFIMSGGVIAGNRRICTRAPTDKRGGGGVYSTSGSFIKTGGVIYGNEAEEALRNIMEGPEGVVYADRGSAAAYNSTSIYYRTTTLGEDDDISTSSLDSGWTLAE